MPRTSHTMYVAIRQLCVRRRPPKYIHTSNPSTLGKNFNLPFSRIPSLLFGMHPSLSRLQCCRSRAASLPSYLSGCDDEKPDNAQCIDKHTRATWPDQEQEPDLYRIVEHFMVHKNCKSQRRLCCQEGGRQCEKGFPKPPQLLTTFDARGHLLYYRSVKDLDIVPCNRTLLLIVDARIDEEVNASGNIVSYMFA